MTTVASPTTWHADVRPPLTPSSPSTYASPFPVPRTPEQCDRVLSLVEREGAGRRLDDLVRFLGAMSSVWTQSRRDRLVAIIASAGERCVPLILDAVTTLPRAELMDEAERVLRSPHVPAAALRGYLFHPAYSSDARSVIVRALGNRGDATVAALLQRALDDAADEVRDAAVYALAKVDGARARTSLEARLSRETSELVRESIRAALDDM